MMTEEDLFYVPKSPTIGLYKEKGSKFLGFLYPVYNEEEIHEYLLQLKKGHPKSRHVCYAYKLAPWEQKYRINDDGEPSGTAGKPIWGQIESAKLHNVLVAVVRYFGGTKLGASGLIRAYKAAAEEACAAVEKQETFERISIKIDFDYAIMGHVMDICKELEVNIESSDFGAMPSMIVGFRKSTYLLQIRKIKAFLLGRPLNDIDDDTQLGNVQFSVI